MKKSIHDGPVTYSVTVPNPAPGEGKHAKTPIKAYRRHIRNMLMKESEFLRYLVIRKENK